MGDLLDDFLDLNKKFQPRVVPTGIVNGRLDIEYSSDDDTEESEEENNADYAKSYQLAEEKLYKQTSTHQVQLMMLKVVSLYQID